MKAPFDLSTLPTQPGCYLFKDRRGGLLYIGKAKNLRKRVSSYFTKYHTDQKTIDLVHGIKGYDVIITDTEAEALLLESRLIRHHKPKFNIMLKENLRYAFIEVTKEEYPRILTARKKIKGKKYFGPFTDGTARREIIRTLNAAFGLRVCKKMPKRVCFYYHIGRCSGPCEDKISKSDYTQRVNQVTKVLQGKSEDLVEQITKQMKKAAQKQHYELAKAKRDQLYAIEHLRDKQKIERNVSFNQDIIGMTKSADAISFCVLAMQKGTILHKYDFTFKDVVGSVEELVSQFIQQYYSEGEFPGEIIVDRIEPEDAKTLSKVFSDKSGHKVKITIPQKGVKKELLALAKKNAMYVSLGTDQSLVALQKSLKLPELPVVIECFDISTLQGKHTVASMVQFRDGKPDKTNYRRFKIKTVEGQDDFASMEEVVYRRYWGQMQRNEQLPSLIVIDGGMGQLSSAMAMLEKLNLKIPIISLAKKEEEIYIPGRKIPLKLDKKKPELKLLQRIRNEAHRFAITYHRLLRSKNTFD